MEETKNSYVGAPDTEIKQEYHKKDKEKGKNKEYHPHEEKVNELKKEEKIVTEEPKVEVKVEDIPAKEVIKPKKKKGKVILISKATISVQDENGNNITVRGHRDDVKIGDIVEY